MQKNLDEKTLFELFITKNLTVKEISEILNVSTATVARSLQKYGIKKDRRLISARISETKQSKTGEEKKLYSKHLSEARKGKGLGIEPWNKGKHTGNCWNGKHHSEETKKKISETKQNKTLEEKDMIEAKRINNRVYGDPWNKGKRTGAWTEEQKKAILAKQYATKKENKSFNSSKAEDKFYEILVKRFGEKNIIRQYSLDERYPFCCDFYIQSEDLFIELNISWTHGGHPFNCENEEDLKKLNIWRERALSSEYYRNAISTWTIRDVAKHKAVIDNNLKYLEFYTEDEAFSYEF